MEEGLNFCPDCQRDILTPADERAANIVAANPAMLADALHNTRTLNEPATTEALEAACNLLIDYVIESGTDDGPTLNVLNSLRSRITD